MSIRFLCKSCAGIFLLLCCCAANSFGAFTPSVSYEGKLIENGKPANGSYDLIVKLFDDSAATNEAASPLFYPDVFVTNGLFTILLQYDSAVFTNGANLWLELNVKNALEEGTNYTRLLPRQQILYTPYAITSLHADTAIHATAADKVNWQGIANAPLWVTQNYISTLFDAPPLSLGTVAEVGDSANLVWIRENSTFSGWGQAVGNPSKFSAVQFYIRAWDPARPITKVRCRIKLNDYLGEVIGDQEVPVNAVIGKAYLVTVDFGQLLNPSGSQLWLEYLTDGHVGQTLVIPSGIPPVVERYATAASTADTSMVEATSSANFYVRFGVPSVATGTFTLSQAFLNAIGTVPTADSIKIDLSSQIFVYEGREMNLYFENFIQANVPFNELEFKVDCIKGAQYANFWRYTPQSGEAGTYPLTVQVLKDGQLITSRSCMLKVADRATTSPVTRKVLTIGDSTTANGIMLTELYNMSRNEPVQLELVGSKGTSPVLHEAVSGWSTDFFYTNSASAFVFEGAFDFASYLSAHSIQLAAQDWVVINLGINDVFSYKDDSSLQAKITKVMNEYEGMIFNIKGAVPGVRVAVAITIPPPHSQDSFATVYGTSQTLNRYRRNRALFAQALLEHFDGRQGEQIFVAPIHLSLDTIYNFTTETVPVNARNTNFVFTVSPNGLHPDVSGYYQIADSMLSFFENER